MEMILKSAETTISCVHRIHTLTEEIAVLTRIINNAAKRNVLLHDKIKEKARLQKQVKSLRKYL